MTNFYPSKEQQEHLKELAEKAKNKKLQTDNSRFVPPDNYMCCSCGKIHNYRIEANGCCR